MMEIFAMTHKVAELYLLRPLFGAYYCCTRGIVTTVFVDEIVKVEILFIYFYDTTQVFDILRSFIYQISIIKEK